jgi:hypothetical protein
MTNKISLPETTLLIYGLAIADALTIMYGLIMLDGVTHDGITRTVIILRGAAIGIVGGLVLAITANRIAYKSGMPRRIGIIMFSIVLVAVALIVAPVTYSAMSPALVAVIPDWVRVAMSVASGVLVPALTAAAAATAGKLDAPAAQVPAPAPEPKRTVPAPAKPATVPCALCGVHYAAVGGKGGHYKKHHKKESKA